MREQAPAFQFYPKDFLTDTNVVAMTLQECGAYIRLLCLCWLERSLPVEMAMLARLCRVSPACFTKLWPALAPCFREVDGRLIQPRLERERQKQDTWRELKAAAGRQGGRPKSTPKAHGKHTQSRTKANKSPPSSSSVSDLPSPISDLQTSVKRDPSADADFATFFNAYPVSRRVGGKTGRAAFDHTAIGLHGDHLAMVLLALEQQKRSEQWQNPKLIPLMTTWLNQERWVQELPAANGTGQAVSDQTRRNLAARDAVLAKLQGEA